MADFSTLGWGFVGTGAMARLFAEDLMRTRGNRLSAVASRDPDRARAFGAPFGATAAHTDVRSLAEDPGVDIVYIATPHAHHAAAVRACLDAGTPVLCEKPLTTDSAEAADLVALARRRRVFLAEAMWMRCNPNIRQITDLVRAGRCGTVRQLRAELGFLADPGVSRLWDPAQGASALFDIGIYPVTFARLILGAPARIAAAATHTERGVDTGGGATFLHPADAVSSLAWTQVAHSDNRAAVSGDGGRIEVDPPMHRPGGFTYAYGMTAHRRGGPVRGHGYVDQIEHVAASIRAGSIEAPWLPLDETVAVLALLEQIRQAAAPTSPAG